VGILITLIGGRSQLAQCFLPISKYPITVLNSEDLNLTNLTSIKSKLSLDKNKYLINFAAFNDVELSESSSDADIINNLAVKELAQHCSETNKVLIQISSDYVFDGLKGNYVESDFPNPINKYGQSRYLGELAIQENASQYVILRTSWLYSHLPTQYNFLSKVKSVLLKNNQILSGSIDAIGSPTSASSLADAINHMMGKILHHQKPLNKIFHFSDIGKISRYCFLEKIINIYNKKFNLCNEINQVSNSSFDLKAKRPLDTSLNCQLFEATFDYKRIEWDTALKKTINQL